MHKQLLETSALDIAFSFSELIFLGFLDYFPYIS